MFYILYGLLKEKKKKAAFRPSKTVFAVATKGFFHEMSAT